MSNEGLYYHDSAPSNQVAMVNTVAENMQGYTRHQIQGAYTAREAMKTLGFPSTRDLVTMVCTGLIKILPINVQDIQVANNIFGPGIPSLKKKMVRKTPPAVVTNYIPVPQHIYNRNPKVVVVADFMFINGIRFLVMVSRGIDLVTSEFVAEASVSNLQVAMARVIHIYYNKGIGVITAMGDMEFNPVRGLLGATDLNTNAAAEHAPEIERKIWVINYRARYRFVIFQVG